MISALAVSAHFTYLAIGFILRKFGNWNVLMLNKKINKETLSESVGRLPVWSEMELES